MTKYAVLAATFVLAAATTAQAQPDPAKALITQDTAALQANMLVVGGSARVQGWIAADGTILNSKGIASVTHFGPGSYCVNLVGSLAAGSLVPTFSFDFDSTASYNVFVTYARKCGSNGIHVLTYQTDTSQAHTYADEGFTIVAP